MDYIRDRKSNISFSLHDSRILQIEINEDKLSLNMDRIFQYTDNEEKWYKGIIEFTNIDKEECNIMVFNAPYGYNEVKSFSGKELSFCCSSALSSKFRFHDIVSNSLFLI